MCIGAGLGWRRVEVADATGPFDLVTEPKDGQNDSQHHPAQDKPGPQVTALWNLSRFMFGLLRHGESTMHCGIEGSKLGAD